MLVSIRQYAASRNVSHTAINKAVKAGKIPLVDGKIDPDVADAAWDRNRDTRQPSKLAGDIPVPQIPLRKLGSTPAPGTLAYAQLTRETARAKKGLMEVQRLEGELISAAAVDAKWSEVGTRTKDEMLSVPTRVVNRLPDEWRREVNAIVTEEVMRALNAVSVAFMPKG